MADSDLNNAGVKAVITLGVLAFVGILAVVVAKIVQVCMRKHYTDIEDSEIDENTRDLIRARLSVIQFKKREIKKARQERVLNVFTRWKNIVTIRKKDRDATLKSQRPEENCHVEIIIDKTDRLTAKENGVLENGGSKLKENGSPRIPRFASFTQSKTAGGAVKPQLETSRTTASNKVNTVKPESPVPRGRPVSSKQRTAANVTLTDVEINNTAKVHIKSVHFEDDTHLEDIKSTSNTDPTKTVSHNGNDHKGNVNIKRDVKTNSDSGKKANHKKINSVTPINENPLDKTDTNKINVQTNSESAVTIDEKT